MVRPGYSLAGPHCFMTSETLTDLFSNAVDLFPADIAKINGVEWNVVRSSGQAGAFGGAGGLWDTYAFSIVGIKPESATIPSAMSRLTYNRSTYQIAGVEQVGATDMYVIHLSNPQRP